MRTDAKRLPVDTDARFDESDDEPPSITSECPIVVITPKPNEGGNKRRQNSVVDSRAIVPLNATASVDTPIPLKKKSRITQDTLTSSLQYDFSELHRSNPTCLVTAKIMFTNFPGLVVEYNEPHVSERLALRGGSYDILTRCFVRPTSSSEHDGYEFAHHDKASDVWDVFPFTHFANRRAVRVETFKKLSPFRTRGKHLARRQLILSTLTTCAQVLGMNVTEVGAFMLQCILDKDILKLDALDYPKLLADIGRIFPTPEEVSLLCGIPHVTTMGEPEAWIATFAENEPVLRRNWCKMRELNAQVKRRIDCVQQENDSLRSRIDHLRRRNAQLEHENSRLSYHNRSSHHQYGHDYRGGRR